MDPNGVGEVFVVLAAVLMVAGLGTLGLVAAFVCAEGEPRPVRERTLRRSYESVQRRPWPGLEAWHDELDADRRRGPARWSESRIQRERRAFFANVVRED